METHLSPEEIRNYRARTMTVSEFARASDHLRGCKACHRGLLAELEKRFPIVIDLDELAGLQDWHLEGEELAAFLEGRMDELDFECASLHLEECGPCMEKASAALESIFERLDEKSPRRKEP